MGFSIRTRSCEQEIFCQGYLNITTLGLLPLDLDGITRTMPHFGSATYTSVIHKRKSRTVDRGEHKPVYQDIVQNYNVECIAGGSGQTLLVHRIEELHSRITPLLQTKVSLDGKANSALNNRVWLGLAYLSAQTAFLAKLT